MSTSSPEPVGEPEVLPGGAAQGPSVTGQAFNQVVPILVRLARPPGLILLLLASVLVLLFAVLGWFHGSGGTGWASWLPLGLAVALALPVAVFGLRRARLNRRTRGLEMTVRSGVNVLVKRPQEGAGASEDAPLSGDSQREVDPQREREYFEAARTEMRRRDVRFMPRFEAGQRAARALAGGDAHAPYLKDDLRVTLLSLVGTVLAIPTAAIGSLIVAILLAVRSAPM